MHTVPLSGYNSAIIMASLDLNSILNSIASLFTGLSFARIHDVFVTIVLWLQPYSTVVSLLILTGIVYCFFRIEQTEEATKHYDHPPEGEASHDSSGSAMPQSVTATRWERILGHVESSRESDWRLAILEADVLLSEMVTGLGYHGESLGEKLKAIEPSDFTSIQKAWEAHGVRNKIAHEGAAFALTEREAKRVISLYEEVFKEFKYI